MRFQLQEESAIPVHDDVSPETHMGGIETTARVLICEDQADLAQTFAALLSLHGHEVRVCHDGRSAIDQALDWRPTAAIIDIGLPGISGYGVAQLIRDLSCGGDVLLIAVTGYASPADLEMARYAGFNWHFSKPAAASLIIDVLQSPSRSALASGDGVLLSPARI